jgi:hypothetical protein
MSPGLASPGVFQNSESPALEKGKDDHCKVMNYGLLRWDPLSFEL